jgi:hypothetical protein
MRKAVSTIIRPDPRKIHSLFWESGTSQGKVDTIDMTALPPARAARADGSAQHRSVPVEVKSAR